MGYSVEQLQAMARATADQYGLNPDIFAGLVQTESSWIVNDTNSTTSAFGLTQVTNAAQQDVGTNRASLWDNAQAQLSAGAAYLKKQLDKFGNYPDALAAYNQGAGNVGTQAGTDYANTVMQNAANLMSGTSSPLSGARKALDDAESNMLQWFGLSKSTADTLTNPNASVSDVASLGLNGWFGRIALGIFALLLIGAALIMFAPKGSITKVAAVAA